MKTVKTHKKAIKETIDICKGFIPYHNPKVSAQLRKGFKEAREGKTERVNDIDSFLDNL